MAKQKIVGLPYIVRAAIREVESSLNRPFGPIMTAHFPREVGDYENVVNGVVQLHFEGSSFKLEVETRRGHYGQEVRVTRISASIGFWSEAAAEEWFAKVQRFAGPIEHAFVSENGYEGKLQFVLEGIALDRLQMNASNRGNGLPTFKWNSSRSPLNGIPTWQETTPAKRLGVMNWFELAKPGNRAVLAQFLAYLTSAGVEEGVGLNDTLRAAARIDEPVGDHTNFRHIWCRMYKCYEQHMLRIREDLSTPST